MRESLPDLGNCVYLDKFDVHSIALPSVIGVVLDNDNSMKIFFVKSLTITHFLIPRPDMIKSSMSVMVLPRYMLLVTMISVVNGWTA